MQSASEQDTAAEPRWRAYALFALMVIGSALGNLSQTGLNAMLPATMAEFGVTVELGQWLTTGYMLMLGVAVPIATYLMKRLDDREYALLCYGLFVAGSLADWLAPWFIVVLLGRLVQATAVGLYIPKMQTISMTKFPPGQRATAMGIAGIALGFAPSVGPTVGGAMDYAFGWRSFFLLLTVLSIVMMLLVLLLVKRNPDDSSPAQLETVSFVLSTLGFGGILLGLSQISSYGIASPWVWWPLLVGIVALVLFIARQQRVENPLMDLRIFKSPVFNNGLLASVFLFACYMGVTLVIPLYVVDVLGGTSLDAGLVTFPTTFTAVLVNPLSGILADKTSPRVSSLIFGSFLVAGSVASVFVSETTPLWLLSIWQTTRAIGVSGLIGPLLTYALSGLEGPLVPHGSSASVVLRQMSATLGTAIMVLCITVLLPGAAGGAYSLALPYQVAFIFSALMGIASLLIIIFRVK